MDFEEFMSNLWKLDSMKFRSVKAMKPASSALISYLNTARANPDVPLYHGRCFTFTLRSGLDPAATPMST